MHKCIGNMLFRWNQNNIARDVTCTPRIKNGFVDPFYFHAIRSSGGAPPHRCRESTRSTYENRKITIGKI
jgi:hypothetical protein